MIKELEQTINTDDAQIKTDKQKYEDMGNDLDAKKQSLDNTNQQAIDAYNQEVKDYNNLGHSFNAEVDQRESVYEDYKAKINAYNTELVQNGTLIK